MARRLDMAYEASLSPANSRVLPRWLWIPWWPTGRQHELVSGHKTDAPSLFFSPALIVGILYKSRVGLMLSSIAWFAVPFRLNSPLASLQQGTWFYSVSGAFSLLGSPALMSPASMVSSDSSLHAMFAFPICRIYTGVREARKASKFIGLSHVLWLLQTLIATLNLPKFACALTANISHICPFVYPLGSTMFGLRTRLLTLC
jgi:hypothetical protein